MNRARLTLVATWIVLASASLGCSRGSRELESHGSGGAPSPSGSSIASSSGAAAGSAGASGGGGAVACSREGWSSASALGTDCRGVCEPSQLDLVPELEFKPRSDWCEGCTFLQTPWAKTTPESAVGGSVRAFGAGPDGLNVGILLDGGKAGIVATYDANLKVVAGFFVDTVQGQPCGRLASVKFSTEGELGAHLVTRIGEEQRLYAATSSTARRLLEGKPRFAWPEQVVGRLAINDMWFSSKKAAIDLSGSVWIGDIANGMAVEVAKLSGAPSGEYSRAKVAGNDVFVSNWSEGRTRWFVHVADGLRHLLGDASHDVRDLVTDGDVMVWLQGSGVSLAPDGTTRFSRYDLMKSPYGTDAKLLKPTVLAADVPQLSNLVLANGRVVGIYLPDPAVVRATALIVKLDGGQQLRSELPNGYSWGYELYPAEQELWGAITSGPMISFETVARIPYARMMP